MLASAIIATVISMVAFVAASPVKLDNQKIGAPDGASLDKRKCAQNCSVKGFAIVDGNHVKFSGTAINLPAKFGHNSEIPNLLPGAGCVLTLVPACSCADWSVFGSTNCGSSRSVFFS